MNDTLKYTLKFLIAVGVLVFVMHLFFDSKPEPERVRIPLDYSKQVYTTGHAVICPQSLFNDPREGHDLHAALNMYISPFDMDSKAEKLGCEVWHGGIAVTAIPIDGTLADINDGLFTVTADLTNNPDGSIRYGNSVAAPPSNSTSSTPTQRGSLASVPAAQLVDDLRTQDAGILWTKVGTRWTAMSHNASAITGDVQTQLGNIAILDHQYPFIYARDLSKDELPDSADLFSIEKEASMNIEGQLFKTNVEASIPLVNGNTICGSENALWILALRSHDAASDPQEGDWLYLAFFSGAAEPVLQKAALDTSTALCGTFSYKRS